METPRTPIKLGDVVQCKQQVHGPPMVVNGMRMGKLECIWFQKVKTLLKGDPDAPVTKQIKLMRAFIHPEALEPYTAPPSSE